MVIETERLFLREYMFDDFNALFEIVSDSETMQHYPAPFDENKTKDCMEFRKLSKVWIWTLGSRAKRKRRVYWGLRNHHTEHR